MGLPSHRRRLRHDGPDALTPGLMLNYAIPRGNPGGSLRFTRASPRLRLSQPTLLGICFIPMANAVAAHAYALSGAPREMHVPKKPSASCVLPLCGNRED